MENIEPIIIIFLVLAIVLSCLLIMKIRKAPTNKEDKTTKTSDINESIEKKVSVSDTQTDTLLSFINPGDIVYCLMPLSKAQLDKVPDGHKERPYLIINKGKDRIYGYYSTTHINERVPYQERYTYRRDFTNKNNEVVDANFVLDKVYKIPERNIINILDSLDQYEREEVARRLAIKNLMNFPDVDINNLKLKIGDIVINESKWYFISDIDKTNIYGYLTYPPKQGTKKGTRVSRKYGPSYYNFNEKVKLYNVSINDLLFISSPTETNNVLKAAEEYKKNLKYRKKKANKRAAKIKKNNEQSLSLSQNDIVNDFFENESKEILTLEDVEKHRIKKVNDTEDKM